MLPYLFSLLEGTKLESYRYGYPAEPKTIPKAGETLFDLTGRGWITAMIFGSDDPYMTIRYEIDEYKDERISPFTLYLAGRWTPAGQLFWLERYWVVGNFYLVAAQPTPWIPFRKHFFVQMFLPPADPAASATLLQGQFEIGRIIDEGLFKKSLREILGLEKALPILREVGLR